ncbi:hypothetical protein [Yinghuangia sp. YIM S09857]|uniref:hypothetical protein n=1 Tax=Yinghuangia sp. YIM S09857 TaxID=3436929 RepID=UPI003F52A0A7
MDPFVLSAFAANPALPQPLLDRLIATADPDTAAGLADRPDLTRPQALALAARAEAAAVRLARSGRLTSADVDPVRQPLAALALLHEGAAPAAWARRLAGDPRAEIRESLAGCPDLPPDVTEALASDPEWRVVAELALWATPSTVAHLARHPHMGVRRAVAANESTPPSALAALVTGEGLPPASACHVCDQEAIPFTHDPDCPRPDCTLLPGDACDGTHQSTAYDILLAALANAATPAEAVVPFAGNASTLVRWAVAARGDLPAAVYARLAVDPIPGVRATVAANPAIGVEVMCTLAADRGHDVARSLAHNPGVPLDILVVLAGATRIGPALLPRVENASTAELTQLAASPNARVRRLVARHRGLPPAVRDALAEDSDARVLSAIAGHPGLGAERLDAMAAAHGSRVLAGVAGNPDASPELLEQLTDRGPVVRAVARAVLRRPDATSEAVVRCLEGDAYSRQLAAEHPRLPGEVVARLLADPDPSVAAAAAANPALPRWAYPDL